MRLFLDTEFNGFMGPLMSLALVPEDEKIRTFYKELEVTGQIEPWVKENVVPHMMLAPCTYNQFQQELAEYLWEVGDCTIVADWPDDIRHLCESLIVGPGMSIPIMYKINFLLDTGIKYESQVPHNALYDAIAIRDVYLKKVKK
jgi:hypothetical protein